jgi:hypothetical protein
MTLFSINKQFWLGKTTKIVKSVTRFNTSATGDIVKAVVTKGKKVGEYVGRVLCRAIGSFDIATKAGRISGINQKHCSAIHKKDGYSYA